VFHRFWQAKFVHGGSILSFSQFLKPPQQSLKMMQKWSKFTQKIHLVTLILIGETDCEDFEALFPSVLL
jgi:hypothetical protein